MGSEMCIRDRAVEHAVGVAHQHGEPADQHGVGGVLHAGEREVGACLLYTSDAADERSSVDLGGRRIIKKKTSDSTARTADSIRISKETTQN